MNEDNRTFHVVMMSSGVGSWAAAKRVVDQHGSENVVLLFTDVKGDNLSPHAGEDEDNYRFLRDAVEDIGVPLVTINTGRDIYDVYDDEHILGNSRFAPCSEELKQKPAREWLDANCEPTATVCIGIDWTETERIPAIENNYAPYRVTFPLLDKPMLDKSQILEACRAEGIRPPRLYDYGFPHANCGGFCCRMGIGQARLLLRVNPERYAYHEAREQAFREKFGWDVSFLRDRRGDKTKPLTLRTLRESIEVQPSLFADEPMTNGCESCFTFMPEKAAV